MGVFSSKEVSKPREKIVDSLKSEKNAKNDNVKSEIIVKSEIFVKSDCESDQVKSEKVIEISKDNNNNVPNVITSNKNKVIQKELIQEKMTVDRKYQILDAMTAKRRKFEELTVLEKSLCNVFTFLDLVSVQVVSSSCKQFFDLCSYEESWNFLHFNENLFNSFGKNLDQLPDNRKDKFLCKWRSIRALHLLIGKFPVDGLLRSLVSLKLGNIVELKVVSSISSSFSSGTPQILGALCPNLTFLDISVDSKFSDRDLQILARGMPNLISFTLLRNYVMTDIGILYLSKNCQSLQHISIDGSSLTDKALLDLTTFCSDLRSVNLGLRSNFKISDSGLCAFSSGCKNLVNIYLPQFISIPPPVPPFDNSQFFKLSSVFSQIADNLKSKEYVKGLKLNQFISGSFALPASNFSFLLFVTTPYFTFYLSDLTLTSWDNIDISEILSFKSSASNGFCNLKSLSLIDIPLVCLKLIEKIFFGQSLAKLSNLVCELKNKELSSIGSSSERVFLSGLFQYLPHLEYLILKEFQTIDDASIENISHNCKCLKYLVISSSLDLSLTDTSILLLHENCKLEFLEATTSQLTDRALEILSSSDIYSLKLPISQRFTSQGVLMFVNYRSEKLVELSLPMWGENAEFNVEDIYMAAPNLRLLALGNINSISIESRYKLLCGLKWCSQISFGTEFYTLVSMRAHFAAISLSKEEKFDTISSSKYASNAYNLPVSDEIHEKYRKARLRKGVREAVEWQADFGMEQTNLDKKIVLGLLLNHGGDY